jgi:hypothetical protein
VSGAAHRPHDQNDEVSSNAHSRLAGNPVDAATAQAI